MALTVCLVVGRIPFQIFLPIKLILMHNHWTMLNDVRVFLNYWLLFIENSMFFKKYPIIMIHTGFGMFWKVMEIDNVIFQGLKIVEKKSISKWFWKSLGFLFGKIQKYPKMDVTHCRINYRIW